MSMLHHPSRPDEPSFDAESFGDRSHTVREFGESLKALLAEAVRIRAVSTDAASKLGIEALNEDPSRPEEADTAASIAPAVRRGLEHGVINARQAAEAITGGDPETARKIDLRSDRFELSREVARLGVACDVLDADSAADLVNTPGLREQAALAGQILLGMVELQLRWERTIDSLQSSGKLSDEGCSRLLQTTSFTEKKEILDRIAKAEEEKDKLDYAVTLGILGSEQASTISKSADEDERNAALAEVDLRIEESELRQAMVNSVERTLERALARKIIGEERIAEYRSIEDVEKRFKAVKHLHVLADLDEELSRSIANLGEVDFDAAPFDLLAFQKGKGGNRRQH